MNSVSSTSDAKLFNKKFLFDGREDTSWSSDQVFSSDHLLECQLIFVPLGYKRVAHNG